MIETKRTERGFWHQKIREKIVTERTWKGLKMKKQGKDLNWKEKETIETEKTVEETGQSERVGKGHWKDWDWKDRGRVKRTGKGWD